LEELAALTDKVRIQVYDLVKDGDKANQYGVDKVPALVFLGDRDYGVRFYGIPYGYEFQSLIETLINVSNGHTDLAETTKQKLKELRSFVHVQVFVTLTCPYCPMLAALAHKFAIESNLIKAEVVDVSEFPQLALKYTVMGVPKTVINEKVEFVGVVPEEQLLEHVNRALQ
jgi:glutaredoxin-like protein